MKVYGVAAALALWDMRAVDIIRVYVTTERLKEFGGLLKWCAKQKKAYHILTSAELETVSGSVHHEGVTLIARARPMLTDEDFSQALSSLPEHCMLVYLDGVQNPHNVGAILRTAAHFGVRYVIGRQGALKSLGSAGYRVAEGGAEHCQIVTIRDPSRTIAELRSKGFQIVATASNGDQDLSSEPLRGRVLLVLGGEVEGVSAMMLGRADRTVRIPGTGHVESLNVSVAAGVAMSHYSAKAT
jgi:TrmH RNA methyltransferase